MGGQTEFPKLSLSVQPKKGNLIVWCNGNTVNGQLDPNVIHCGKPIIEGEKFCCNFWLSFQKSSSKRTKSQMDIATQTEIDRAFLQNEVDSKRR